MYAAKRLSCGPGVDRRDPTKQFYIKMFFYGPVVLAARGNSHSRPENASSGAILGVPRCPTMRQERVVAPLSAMRFGGRSRFPKALIITTGCLGDTRAYRPPRNIFRLLRTWPKTLSDFAFGEARFLGTAGLYPSPAAVDPFRPGRDHHITQYYAAAGVTRLASVVR